MLISAVLVAVLAVQDVLFYFEHRSHAQERARLIQAALATSPEAAAAAVRPYRPGKQAETPRPELPIGL